MVLISIVQCYGVFIYYAKRGKIELKWYFEQLYLPYEYKNEQKNYIFYESNKIWTPKKFLSKFDAYYLKVILLAEISKNKKHVRFWFLMLIFGFWPNFDLIFEFPQKEKKLYNRKIVITKSSFLLICVKLKWNYILKSFQLD